MTETALTHEAVPAQPQAEADETGAKPSADDAPAASQRVGDVASAGVQRRPLRTVGLVTVIASLITGLLGLAGLGFVTLRDDIRAIDTQFAQVRVDIAQVDAKIDTQVGMLRDEIAQVRTELGDEIAQVDAKIDTQIALLRDDVNQGFARVDARFAQVDDRFAEVNAVLLDHTDRLARIETGHGERLARIEAAHGVPPHP
ncbi:MAG: hypothetical protein OXH86_07765 [Acidimicrobiaceae bacterium]|nr:hypothetical protein [Acidimicrobiaceae bacterium]